MIRKHLHRQIYFTVVICLVLVAVFAGTFLSIIPDRGPKKDLFDLTAELTHIILPKAELSREEQSNTIRDIGDRLNIDMALYGTDKTLIGSYGKRLPIPDFDDYEDEVDGHSNWQSNKRRGGWTLKLSDGRWFVARPGHFTGRPPLIGLALFLATITVAIGLGAYPFVRRLTGRLQRLQQGVEQVGEGNLASRVSVEGKDEIASLANSFNTAASQIERLVNSNRQLLANASHELRTPLSRIRLGIEMVKDQNGAASSQRRFDALERDISELDGLIDEILIMSRLDSGTKPAMNASVDLLGIAAEEASRFDDCSVEGEAAPLLGNEKLLRRLTRNLIENGLKHGAAPVTVNLSRKNDTISMRVTDSGAGIPVDIRQKVFEPFFRAPDKQNIEGFGLGLSLVAQIAEAHGGTAEIADGPTSTIIVTLPTG